LTKSVSHLSDGKDQRNKTTQSLLEHRSDVANEIMQSVWLWLSFAWLAGGFYLLIKRIICLQTPLAKAPSSRHTGLFIRAG